MVAHIVRSVAVHRFDSACGIDADTLHEHGAVLITY
jgi:hypothetical protein